MWSAHPQLKDRWLIVQAIELIVERMAAELEAEEVSEPVEATADRQPDSYQPVDPAAQPHEPPDNSAGPLASDTQTDEASIEPESGVGEGEAGEEKGSAEADGPCKIAAKGGKTAGKDRAPPRNRPCSCGSGRKYKNCCGAAKAAAARRAAARSEAVKSDPDRVTVQMESLYV